MNSFLNLINYAAQRPEVVRALAMQFGLDEKQTDTISQMLMSAVAGGLLNNIKLGGLDDLINALETGRHEDLFTKTKTPGENLFGVVQEGNQILGHILGSKEVSRKVSGAVEKKTNIEATIIKTMLPIIATVVMGLLSDSLKTHGSEQLKSNLLAMLDMDQDGSSVDDIIQLVATLK